MGTSARLSPPSQGPILALALAEKLDLILGIRMDDVSAAIICTPLIQNCSIRQRMWQSAHRRRILMYAKRVRIISLQQLFKKNIESIFHVLLLIGSQALVHPFDLHLL